MNKSTAYTILGIAVGIIIVALGVAYFVFLRTPATSIDLGPDSTSEGRADLGGFGGTSTDNQPSTPDEPVTPTATTTDERPEPPKLRKISDGPVAGAVAYDVVTKTGKTSTTTTHIRFIDRINGAIYETRTDVLDTEKIASASIQKIREAFWAKDGNSVYLRYVTDTNPYTIETYLAKLVPAKNATTTTVFQSDISFLPQEVRGSFLSRNLTELIPSPFTVGTIFYTSLKGSSIQGILSSRDDSRRVEVLNSPITEWTSQWLAPNIFGITTKASTASDGFMYFLNTDTQKLDRVLGNIRGLTTLASSDQVYVIYSNSRDNGFTTRLLNTRTGTTDIFSFTVLPEKCTWSKKQPSLVYCAVPQYLPNGAYPDSWYQGMISFVDDIWQINAATGSTKLLASLTATSKEQIDVTKPFLDPRENYLFFTNKSGGALWSLALPVSSNK